MSSSSPTVCHDQALSQFPLVLQPLRKYPQPPSPKSSPSESLSDWGKDTFDRQTGRLECFLVLPALVIAILFAASGTLLSLYFSIWRGVPRPAGFMPSQPAFYVSDGGSGNASLLGLTITTVITHAMWISSLWLVAIAAYCVAGSWIAYQQHSREDGVHSPTPLQYGFILKLLSTPSVGSIYHSGRYILDYRRRVPISPVLCLAFCLVTLIVAENYLISLADIYLHATSSMVSVNTTDLLHEPKDFGVAFNESLCHPLQSGNGNECSVFAQTDWASADSIFVRRALQIASNSSPFSVSVTTLGNASDLAVVIPSSTDPSLSFEAPSFGVRAQCRNLTPLCLTDSPSIYNCTSAGYPQLPVNTTSDTFGTRIALDPGSASDSHSQTVLLQMVWPFSVTHLPNTVVASLNSSRLGAWSACEMAFYNLTLRHVAGQYEVVGEPTFSGATFAKLMSTPLVSPVLSFQLISNLQATILSQPNEDTVMTALNQELGRLSLAMFAGSLVPAPTSFLSASQTTLLGRYPLGPVIVYEVVLYSYSLLAGILYIWSTCLRSTLVRFQSRKSTTALRMAQIHLTEPLTLVATNFASRSHDHPLDLFVEDMNTARLEIGIKDNDRARPVFGVHKRLCPKSGEIF